MKHWSMQSRDTPASLYKSLIKEGFCLCVTEALWKETPVVASNVGGIPVQIEDGKNGFLLEPKDDKGFADKIIHLLKNPEECKKLGIEAKKLFEKSS